MSRSARLDGATEHEDYTKNRRRGERQRAVRKPSERSAAAEAANGETPNMAEHNPWRRPAASPDAAAAGPHYDPAADCRVRFTAEESERCMIVSEWHASLRKAHGLEPEPDALRALLAAGCESFMAWSATRQAMIEAASEDDDDDINHDVRH